jgi:hypothetical protein
LLLLFWLDMMACGRKVRGKGEQKEGRAQRNVNVASFSGCQRSNVRVQVRSRTPNTS